MMLTLGWVFTAAAGYAVYLFSHDSDVIEPRMRSSNLGFSFGIADRMRRRAQARLLSIRRARTCLCSGRSFWHHRMTLGWIFYRGIAPMIDSGDSVEVGSKYVSGHRKNRDIVMSRTRENGVAPLLVYWNLLQSGGRNSTSAPDEPTPASLRLIAAFASDMIIKRLTVKLVGLC